MAEKGGTGNTEGGHRHGSRGRPTAGCIGLCLVTAVVRGAAWRANGLPRQVRVLDYCSQHGWERKRSNCGLQSSSPRLGAGESAWRTILVSKTTWQLSVGSRSRVLWPWLPPVMVGSGHSAGRLPAGHEGRLSPTRSPVLDGEIALDTPRQQWSRPSCQTMATWRG